MRLPTALLAFTFLFASARANTEKVIFTAPESIIFGDARPSLLDLRLESLTPTKFTLRAALPVAFPTDKKPRGVQSWYLLQTLTQGQRYEVRVCWPATQPTTFWIETYNITHVFDTPSLIQDLAAYAETRQEDVLANLGDTGLQEPIISQSALFLRVWAAADYHTSNLELMQAPLPVDVDIILDPYLLNIFPRSLLPTAAYIILLAVGGYYISGFAWKRIEVFLDDKEHTD